MAGRARTLLLLTLVGLSACFIESAQPSTFRFTCSKTDECPAGEVCSDSLCQRPCGDGLEACGNATFCVNGFCSNICPLDQEVCPGPQECVPLSPEEDAESGVCTMPCDDAERPCAEGQLCLVGLCFQPCTETSECGSGEECTEVVPGFSICAPSGSGGGFP